MNELNKIEQFIKDNNLDFVGSGSDLNANCVVLAGYACYLGFSNIVDIFNSFINYKITSEAKDELDRVFEYAVNNNYKSYWTTEEAKKKYKF